MNPFLMAAPAVPLGFRDVLSVRAVRRLWLAQVVSVFGDFLAVFAVFSVVTFQLHGTPTQVSMILVAFLAPFALVSPVAGVYVDKWNTKWTMISSDLIRAVLVLILLFLRDLWSIYAVLFLLSTTSTFFVPAQSIAVRALTPAAGLLAVNALMSQAMQASQIISPGVSGLLVDWLGASSCFVFDSFSFLFSAAMVATLTIQRQGAAPSAGKTSVMRSFLEGVRFIFTHAEISFVMLSMATGMFAVRCFGGLLSVYVRDVLSSTATAFGLLNSCVGIGMIAGTMALRHISRRITPRFMVAYGLAGMGVTVLVTAIFGTVVSTAIGMLGLGVCAAMVMVTTQTLLQQETPHELLGRVTSAMWCLLALAQVVAMLGAGPVAQVIEIRNLYFASAAMLFVIGGVGYAWLRREKPEPGIA
jgi:MFS family permease